MTRDEAMSKVYDAIHDGDINGPMLVDALAALGVLKLDVPLTPVGKAIDVMRSRVGVKLKDWERIDAGLKAAGLRIVEADK